MGEARSQKKGNWCVVLYNHAIARDQRPACKRDHGIDNNTMKKWVDNDR